MKKLIVVLVIIVAIILVGIILPAQEKEYDYLRLHIRANSNSVVDQNVKYEIKDKMVSILTPFLCDVSSKAEAIKIVNRNKILIQNECIAILRKRGFDYSVNIKINNEYFPTRTYCNTTLESGFYDAVIVELGQAEGDNWWCVMYPPLCFVNKNENNTQIKFKSIICEWFNKLFS